MSATFQFRKAWKGWSLSGGINVPTRTTAIAGNELYMYNVDTSNSIDASLYPVPIPTGSIINKSFEVWLYLYMTKAPSGNCTNFKFWGPAEIPATGVEMYYFSTSFANFHTPLQSSAKCTSLATNYNSIGSGKTFPGRCSQVGSASGYFVQQARVDSSAGFGLVDGITMVYHYGYDET